MSRNKALTVLQKTYDDSYLSCSTAVYHESQVSASRCSSANLLLFIFLNPNASTLGEGSLPLLFPANLSHSLLC